MKLRQILAGGLLIFFTISANAQTPVEVKLIAPIDEDRGWCLDLRGGQNNGAPIGGVHGHTCYTYHGNGPTKDQAFVMENIRQQNEFRMVESKSEYCIFLEVNNGPFKDSDTIWK